MNLTQQLAQIDAIIGGLLGLAGGAVTVLLWEVFLRPAREGRVVAEVLAAEVSYNLQYLVATIVRPNRRGIGADFKISTQVFDSTLDRLGFLPPQLVHEVVFLYQYFDVLNGYRVSYADLLRDFRTYAEGTPNRAAAEQEIQQLLVVFGQSLEKAVKRVELVQPLLLKAGRPWWSIRRWRSAKPKALDVDAMKQRMARAMAERNQPPAQ